MVRLHGRAALSAVEPLWRNAPAAAVLVPSVVKAQQEQPASDCGDRSEGLSGSWRDCGSPAIRSRSATRRTYDGSAQQ